MAPISQAKGLRRDETLEKIRIWIYQKGKPKRRIPAGKEDRGQMNQEGGLADVLFL